MFSKPLLAATTLCFALSAALDVVTFDGSATTFKFVELNDPVMGGKSTGTWDQSKGYGVFDGEVVDVPSLSAPGFVKASADGTFPDISAAAGGSLLLKVRSTTPSYTGFRLSFASGTLSPAYACSGGGSLPLSRGCFKTKFSVPAGNDFTTITIPLSSFSDMWSPATGEHTKECADDADVCPTAEKLAGIKRFEVWAEGVKGKIHLEVESISAQAASGEVTMLAAAASTCPGSASFIHAKTQLSVGFSDSCVAVMGEIQRRVAGQSSGAWVDPHNAGKYSITSATTTQLMLERASGTGGGGGTGYNDKMIFTFAANGNGCNVDACSESQVTSVLDFSTNYCNLHDLYCSDTGCNVGSGTALKYDESITRSSSGQHSTSDCYKVTLPAATLSEVQPIVEEATATTLATFDGSSTSFEWLDQNDPVMGGSSTSSFEIQDGVGVFNGTCAIVGFLNAPGFSKITSQAPGKLNDVSAHINGSLQLRVRSSTPEYKGFKVAFSAQGIPKTSIFGGGSFKAGFAVEGTDWQTVEVPFSDFSYDWSGYTGQCDTKDPGMFPGVTGKQHYCCSAAHPEVCPTADFLKKMTDVEVWAEGVVGDFHIELKSLSAVH